MTVTDTAITGDTTGFGTDARWWIENIGIGVLELAWGYRAEGDTADALATRAVAVLEALRGSPALEDWDAYNRGLTGRAAYESPDPERCAALWMAGLDRAVINPEVSATTLAIRHAAEAALAEVRAGASRAAVSTPDGIYTAKAAALRDGGSLIDINSVDRPSHSNREWLATLMSAMVSGLQWEAEEEAA